MAPANPLNSAILKAVLGPTNTGKTHYAVERMLARSSGCIGLPLRLLAREVYDKICTLKPRGLVALVTGEEKIIPPNARYYVCTVEAMPTQKRFAFVAIDEIQLMSHYQRGHIFTDRLLHARGTQETLFLGAQTVRPIIAALLPDCRFERRERLSTLSYNGLCKLSRLPKRSVIIAFSTAEVYAIAELIRRQRGGAAIVMGTLSPRTRNAQAALFQSGEVDFLIATDAVGMGLNLDTEHVAFASIRKFDGRIRRMLSPMELGQIAGRAGRYKNNGTFGATADCPPLDSQTIARIESHEFEPMTRVEWRNSALDYSTLESLSDSLHRAPPNPVLRRVATVTDEQALARMSAIPEVAASVSPSRIDAKHAVKRLWELCQIPDFRNVTIDAHVRLLQDVYRLLLANQGKLPDDFMQKRVSRLDDTGGSVDILSQRLAQIRTWTYCANKTGWMFQPGYWIDRTREVEARLSDALHEGLIERFVDRRMSALLKGIGTGMTMEVSIKDSDENAEDKTKASEVWVDGHKIGQLEGLRFIPDESGSPDETKTLLATAAQALGPEIDRRLTSLSGGTHAIFTLSDAGEILWGGKTVGRIAASGSVFNPEAELIGGQFGQAALQAMATGRMRDYLKTEVTTKLAPLEALKTLSVSDAALAESKGFAFTLLEGFGTIDRRKNNKIVKDLSPEARKELREAGAVFGQYTVFMREMLKPKPATILSLLVAYGAGGDKKPFIPFAGVTSIANEGDLASSNYNESALALMGFKACGPRIIRFDILDRLSGQIRQAQSENSAQITGSTTGPKRFQIMQEMLALLGSSFDDVKGVLTSLNYKSEAVVPAPKPTPEVDAKPATEAKAVTEAVAADAPTPAPTTPTPAPRRAGPKPLNVYVPREQDANGNTVILENNEYWFMEFRKKSFSPADKSRSFAHKGGKKNFKKSDSKRDNRPNSRTDKPKSKPKPAMRPEDSPFAALMALKNKKD